MEETRRCVVLAMPHGADPQTYRNVMVQEDDSNTFSDDEEKFNNLLAQFTFR